MFSSFGNSWKLVKASWAILNSDRELLWFPIISGVAMLIFTLVFFIPMVVVTGVIGAVSGSGESVNEVVGFIIMFIYYLVNYTVVIFCNTGLIAAAMIRMDGGDPTFRDGWNAARSRMGIIIQYALISATVGVILRFIQERAGILGQFVSFLGNMAWNLLTFLVIPILVTKDVSAIDAIKESASLFRKTWGEQVVGNFGLGAFFGLVSVGIIFVSVGLIMLIGAATESGMAIFIIVMLMIMAFIAMGIISSALGGIYQAALYRYAETGTAPDDYDISMIQGAFKPKNKR